MSVVIETTLGDVTVDLFVEERPQTCLNFLKLCKIKYYNLCLFHSVSSNFLAQTGDPTGKGDGGESIFGVLKGKQHRLYLGEKMPKLKHDRTGLLSMVSHGEGMLGSQFIITLSGNLTSLDQEHCVFGHVVEGVELLLKLNEAITDDQHRPYQDIRITHTVILEDPFPDPEGLEVPIQSPVPPNPKDAAYSRIPADEPLTENYSQEELDEMVQQREAAARAAILEMVGDIPNADIAPPENVLFVCKLNPVTSDHDLSIIFSRFGKVKSCEVIRDQITGDSLQYAFIEFENRKACEEAYFKMDNVLIDDRRIHVDFSQSVAKLKWKGKGRGVEHLGPPPPGGWGNRVKNNVSRDSEPFKNHKPFRKNEKKSSFSNGREAPKRGKGRSERMRRDRGKREKTERGGSSSSSSSSDSDTELTDSSSASSSSSSDSRGRLKRKRGGQVLVVVKTPGTRGCRRKKKKNKNKAKKRKRDSASDCDGECQRRKMKKKKRRKKIATTDSSDSDHTEESTKKKGEKKSRSTVKESRDKKKRKYDTPENTSESSSAVGVEGDAEKREKDDDGKSSISSSSSSSSRSSSSESGSSSSSASDGVTKKKRRLVERKKRQYSWSSSDSKAPSRSKRKKNRSKMKKNKQVKKTRRKQ